MEKLGIFFTCFNETRAVEFALKSVNTIYRGIPIYLVSEGKDFSYLSSQYNLHYSQEEDTMTDTFKVTNVNFKEPIHQQTIKKAALAVISRLKECIKWCDTEYILMMDPDCFVRGPLNIPQNVKLLGSRVNKGFPQAYKDVLSSIPGAVIIDEWGATPGIFHVDTFLKGCKVLEENPSMMDRFCFSFNGMYAHDVLLPTLFALVGERETFNPDIIECKRDPSWLHKPNPLVH